MKILYIGTVITDETIEKIYKKCKTNKPTMAGILFDRNVAQGVGEYAEIEAVSLIPVPSYPNCKKIIVKAKKEEYNNIQIKYTTLINLPIIKYIFYIFSLCFYLINWNIKNRKEKNKIVILASPDIMFSLPCIILKNILKNKVISCVTDLPEFTINYRKDTNIIKKKLLNIKNHLYDKVKSKMDGYIFLSKYMNEKVNTDNKPYVVIDGLVNVEEILNNEKIEKNKNKVLMYAGGLNVSYGINTLIDAFMKANVENSELWLFGSGDYENEIREICKQHKNIKFMGQVEHSKVIRYEKEATLLINPRPTTEEYVKYSFPSKTLEYMLTGTPLMTTNLPTITEDYKEYLFIIKDENIDEITISIREHLTKSQEELTEFGNKAKQYIIKEKNVKKQCKKIMNLISNL